MSSFVTHKLFAFLSQVRLSGFDYHHRYHPLAPRCLFQTDNIELTMQTGETVSVYDPLSAPGLVATDATGKPFYFYVHRYYRNEAEEVEQEQDQDQDQDPYI